MAHTLLRVLCICLLYRNAVLGVTLHFSSQNSTQRPDGVYKMVVDVDALLESPSSQVSKIENYLTCTHLGNRTTNRMSVRSMSYDSVTNRTVIQTDLAQNFMSPDIISEKACNLEKECRRYSPYFIRLLLDKERENLKAIASWNDTVYFLYAPDTKNGDDIGYRPSLQLRKITIGCEFPQGGLNINSASTVLAEIKIRGLSLKAGSSLVIVPRENDLCFLTVVLSIQSNNRYNVYFLVAIIGDVSIELTNTLHLVKNGTAEVESEGAVGYKDGTLCWSGAVFIRCGAWSPDQSLLLIPGQSWEETRPRFETVLAAGQASVVCEVVRGKSTIRIAIAETLEKDGRLALFFGCYGSETSNRGIGLLVKDPSKAEVDIIPVRYNNETIQAQHMFLTSDDLCVGANSVQMSTETVSEAKPVKEPLLLHVILGVVWYWVLNICFM